MSKASQYSELATGMYGSSMIYGVMGEIDSPDDVKRLLNGKKDREGYKQAFLDHAHLAADAILYTNWGCEDRQSLALTTASGVEITAPPYFLVRHDATRSIVLCVRGTWNIKDFITDFKCCGVAWERGKAHEGIALVVDSLLEDEELNEAIVAALAANPDYRMVAVGHSLGAGIAALLTIRWRALKRFNNPVCFAIAPPPCLSVSVRDKGVGYVYSFVNEDDVVPRLSKDGIMDCLKLIAGNCHKKRGWFHKVKKNVKESYMSMFGNEGTLLNMYLPGSVFYLHPCIDHYTEYENRKRFAVNVSVTMSGDA